MSAESAEEPDTTESGCGSAAAGQQRPVAVFGLVEGVVTD